MYRFSLRVLPLALAPLAIDCTSPSSDPAPVPALASAPAPGPREARAPAAWPQGSSSAVVPTTPPPPFPDGERAFAKARATLGSSYYREVKEDDLYRAALGGMLERLDPALKGYNTLLTPLEAAWLHADLEGEIVGVGIEIDFQPSSGHIDVRSVIPRSAAERAGIERGDSIVSVDGELFKGRGVGDVLEKIRGKAGSQVTFRVLRGDRVLPFTVTREVLVIEPVEALMLPNHVGYLRVRSFSAKTMDRARVALTDLGQKGAQALVLDLRANQGGSFDEAIATAGLFLAKGSTVAVAKKRAGKEEPFVSKGDPILAVAPLAVLVDGKTSSGAELLAGALQEGRKAELVGARTFGKWTVQMLDELGNGYAMKYTIGVFATPGGRSFDGVGMAPDVEVDMDDAQRQKAMSTPDATERLAADVQLRTAVGLLRR